MKKYPLLIITTIFLGNVYAGTTSCDTINTSVNNLETSVTNQQKLVSKLSDDIGTMADRIGTMADKIVKTEDLLSQTLLTITGNKTLTNTVALTKPLDSTTAQKNTPPTIELSDNATTYLLYASTDAKFDRAKSLIIYVDTSNDTLKNSWSQVADLAGTNNDVIYIAVKSINNNVISALSNETKLTLQ